MTRAVRLGIAMVVAAAAAVWACGGGERAGADRAVASEAARVRAAVDALPELGRIDSGPTPVIVRGDVASARRAREVLAMARAVHDDVGRRFVAPRAAGSPPVTIVVADRAADYETITATFDDVPSPLGFYRPDLRVAVVNLARGIGNLRHELVHPLVADDFPAIPDWLDEGLGSLYGTAVAGRRGLEPMVNYRLVDLQRALKAGTLPSFEQLIASTSADVHGDDAMTYYALGRYVLLYLHRERTLDATYAALRAAAGDRAAQLRVLRAAVDEARFRTWAAGLRYRRARS